MIFSHHQHSHLFFLCTGLFLLLGKLNNIVFKDNSEMIEIYLLQEQLSIKKRRVLWGWGDGGMGERGWEGRIGNRLQPGYKINRLKEKKKKNITEVSKYKAPRCW